MSGYGCGEHTDARVGGGHGLKTRRVDNSCSDVDAQLAIGECHTSVLVVEVFRFGRREGELTEVDEDESSRISYRSSTASTSAADAIFCVRVLSCGEDVPASSTTLAKSFASATSTARASDLTFEWYRVDGSTQSALA